MFGSPLLGMAIGLVLLFAITALLCSGITETVSNLLQMRAKYLLTGMRTLLDGPEQKEPQQASLAKKQSDQQLFQACRQQDGEAVAAVKAVREGTFVPGEHKLTEALFATPQLETMLSRRVSLRPTGGPMRTPQYLSGRAFARALVDLLVPAEPDGNPPVELKIETIRKTVEQLPRQLPVRRQLLLFLAAAEGKVEAFELSVEQWYDEQMAKIGSWYKRWSRVVLGIVGLVVAVALNLDTFQAAHTLYVDTPVQQAVVASADAGVLCQDKPDAAARRQCATDELTTLQAAGLPVGWPLSWPFADLPPGLSWVLKVLGWGITAFAVSFGAPFWFEALSKLGSLRTAAKRPDDK
jgi:hypothetical protein